MTVYSDCHIYEEGLKKGVDLNALRRLENYLEPTPFAKSANSQKPVANIN